MILADCRISSMRINSGRNCRRSCRSEYRNRAPGRIVGLRLAQSQAAPEPRTMTPEKPQAHASPATHADIDVALLEDPVAGERRIEIVAT